MQGEEGGVWHNERAMRKCVSERLSLKSSKQQRNTFSYYHHWRAMEQALHLCVNPSETNTTDWFYTGQLPGVNSMLPKQRTLLLVRFSSINYIYINKSWASMNGSRLSGRSSPLTQPKQSTSQAVKEQQFLLWSAGNQKSFQSVFSIWGRPPGSSQPLLLGSK